MSVLKEVMFSYVCQLSDLLLRISFSVLFDEFISTMDKLVSIS